MRFDIISAVPELLLSPFQHSILKRAQEKNKVSIFIHNLRDFSIGNYKQIDDYAYGGGAGMVMMAEPIARCIQQLKSQRDYDAVIYTAPDGEIFSQARANAFSLLKNVIILCGHYKGVDERVREKYITHEISIGDYVISGGELAASIIVDSVVRLLPGVLNDETSALTDSFQDNLIAPPVYTRPEVFEDSSVPEILLSGNEAKISEWRFEESLKRTKQRRPHLLN